MKTPKMMNQCVIALAAAGLLIPRAALAEAPAAGPRVIDAALAEEGTFRGQVVSTDGVPKADADVVLLRKGQAVATVRTDKQGRFAVRGLRGGVYQVSTGGAPQAFRLWTPGTAPPAAVASNVMLVDDGQVVRGQYHQGWGIHSLLSHLYNPYVIAGGVAAAIAIPLALDDDDAS